MQGKRDYVYNHKGVINQILRAEYEKKNNPIFFNKAHKKIKRKEGLL